MAKEHIIASVDIGTGNVRAVIGEVRGSEELDILGRGEAPSEGVRRGVIVNIESAANALSEAVEAAEVMAGVEVGSVIAALNGDHIQSLNSKGVIGVTARNREITAFEVERVVESARSIRLPAEREIIHVMAQEFAIDEQDGIKSPVGMAGTRLEAEVHVITGAHTAIDNLFKVAKKAGLAIDDIVVGAIAAPEATLTEDEREIGVALVDIGKATTNVAIFIEGAIWHTAVLPVGGDHITNDIAMGLRMSAAAAEETKMLYGVAHAALVGEEELIEAPSVGDRPPRTVQKRALAEIIEPRVEEIFRFVLKEIEKADCRNILAAGAVVVGGTAQLEGICETAESALESMGVRVGYPRGFTGMTDLSRKPDYATVVGLLRMHMSEGGKASKAAKPAKRAGSSQSSGATIGKKLGGWFREFFS